MSQKSLLVLILFVLWGYISWQWYTCGIKGMCIVHERGHMHAKEQGKHADSVHIFVVDNTQASPLTTRTTNCPGLLHDYLKMGHNNNTHEVQKLQTFLRDVEGIDVSTTGIFDPATEKGVMQFQAQYAKEVLSQRWGISTPTGFVYKTTQAKINDRFCEYLQSKTKVVQ